MNACGKKTYGSWAHASSDAKALRRKGDVPLAVYRCRYCQAWHVGNRQIERSSRREYSASTIRL